MVTKVRVWLSHDGYRDPDDNLSMLVGAAYARTVDKASAAVSVAGVVFGDTKDGGQYYMLNPAGHAPKGFGSDPRYGDKGGNKVAAGNYEFYKDYAKAALEALAPGWGRYDLLAQDKGGLRAWNFDAESKGEICSAAAALADDIRAAIAGDDRVVYSAGGGANVAAEAIGYLANQGFRQAAIEDHFAIVQHGRSNWGNQYEAEARDLTREYTIAISNQNLARYKNGVDGPDLKHAVPNPGRIDGAAFGAAFDRALEVAVGKKGFAGLKPGASFRATTDASDAGSHAFAVDAGRLAKAWDDRMQRGDTLPDGDAWAHRIDTGGGARLRVVYNEFTAEKIAALLDGDFRFAAADEPDGPSEPGTGGSDKGSGGFDAPFATHGKAVVLGGAEIRGFGIDGKAAAVGAAKGKLGVADVGDGNEIDRHGKASEKLGLDFGAAVEAVTLRLAGLGAEGGAREAARLVAYDADGDVADAWLISGNGATRVDFDAAVRYATLEVAGGLGEPDFALTGLGLDYM
jgi:hypothetical protein